MSHQFYSATKLLSLCGETKTIHEVMETAEHELTRRSVEEIRQNMAYRLNVMRESIEKGEADSSRSQSGMAGGDSLKIKAYREAGGETFHSPVAILAMEYAIAVMECNARMGKIVAAPTAGSSGIIPGGLWAMTEHYGLDESAAVDGMLTASAIGVIIAHNATFSAAAAGCQAEVGSSSAMAAAAISAMRGMSPERCVNAAALSLKNMLGLACDPIGGFVEVPCVKRNALGITHAMAASDMSLMGVTSIVPFDEVVMAMNNVAKHMHSSIRETSKGGLAITPTARKIVLGMNLKKKRKKGAERE